MDCKLVSSRGILDICDWKSHHPVSSITSLEYDTPLYWLDDNTPTVAYVCSSAIPRFILDILPTIKNKIILVSGDCDQTIPTQIFRSETDYESFITDDRIVHWFCQNFVGNHPKVSQMPIGMDYHTMASGDHLWGKQLKPYKQEEQLFNLKNNSLPFWERALKIHASFHISMTGRQYVQDRLDVIEMVSKELIDYDDRCERLTSWKHQTEYAFVACPYGNGLDTHRFWEALNLGCIPIIKSSPLDTLFSELPVWIVQSWGDITFDKMKEIVSEFKQKSFNYDKLTTEYWIRKIYSYKFDLAPIFNNKITVAGCVRNVSKYSSHVMKNITLLKCLFKVEPKILASYDKSNDDTLDKYRYIGVDVLTDDKPLSDQRTVRIADARNRILEHMEGDYLFMIDFDDVFSKQFNINTIRNVIQENRKWDIVSFNNKNEYYDWWAFTVGPFVYSCWHVSDPYKIMDEMSKYRKYIMAFNKGRYIDCVSAFDVMAVYKIDKIRNIRYAGGYDKSELNLMDVQNFCKIYDVKVSVPGTIYDCEHRQFGRLATREGLSIKIYKDSIN
jgi:hypothetical protein